MFVMTAINQISTQATHALMAPMTAAMLDSSSIRKSVVKSASESEVLCKEGSAVSSIVAFIISIKSNQTPVPLLGGLKVQREKSLCNIESAVLPNKPLPDDGALLSKPNSI